MTGSGKTEILEHLAKSGQQVLNIEELANHKGSAFGSIGCGDQPSTEQFENNLFEHWSSFDFLKPVYIEDESFIVGKVQLPHELFDQMQIAPIIEIEIDKKFRINRLIYDYASANKNQLKDCVLKISKRLGGLNTNEAIHAIENGLFARTAEILLNYYDKTYLEVMNKRDSKKRYGISLNSEDPEINAGNILKFVKENKINGAD
jgi:tRNA 2-selenouridine synthase